VYTLRRTQRATTLSVKMNMRVALLVVACLALGCNGRLLLADTPAISISVPKNGNDVWDYMMLVQQWPVELCQHAGSHNCILPSVGWTIHGLWPDYNSSKGHSGPYPQFCSSEKFDLSQVADLQADLNEFWPNCFTDTPHADLWKHEFEKHGTCAMESALLNSENDYFSAALKLRREFDFGVVLSKGRVTPSSSAAYSVKQVMDAVVAYMGVEPYLECSWNRATHTQAIWQIGICIDKTSLRPFSCSAEVIAKSNCRSTESVVYEPMPGSHVTL